MSWFVIWSEAMAAVMEPVMVGAGFGLCDDTDPANKSSQQFSDLSHVQSEHLVKETYHSLYSVLHAYS